MEILALKARIEDLLKQATPQGTDVFGRANGIFHGTITVLSTVHGLQSEQVKALRKVADETILKYPGSTRHAGEMIIALAGVLNNLKVELDAGLVGSLQKRIAGDVLTDFIQLARAVLDEPGDGAKNVAAVLAAAAYEDTIRRMGSAFAGVVGRDDLSKVIDALKMKGLLVAPQLGIAISYLNFRNHALHAEWGKIDRASVQSVLGFVEQLLLKHFA